RQLIPYANVIVKRRVLRQKFKWHRNNLVVWSFERGEENPEEWQNGDDGDKDKNRVPKNRFENFFGRDARSCNHRDIQCFCALHHSASELDSSRRKFKMEKPSVMTSNTIAIAEA